MTDVLITDPALDEALAEIVEDTPATYETPEGDERSAAIGLGLAVLRKTGYATWAELLAAGDEAKDEKFGALHFSPDQLQLLETHHGLLTMISPGVTPSPCTECGVPVLVGKGAPGNNCTVTNGCKGKPGKPAAAKLTPKPKK